MNTLKLLKQTNTVLKKTQFNVEGDTLNMLIHSFMMIVKILYKLDKLSFMLLSILRMPVFSKA